MLVAREKQERGSGKSVGIGENIHDDLKESLIGSIAEFKRAKRALFKIKYYEEYPLVLDDIYHFDTQLVTLNHF